MADSVDAEEEEGSAPTRRCIITREILPKQRMIRFVLDPAHNVVPDLAARLPGRGIWLSARGDVLQDPGAQRKLAGHFARAARGPVTVPSDLVTVLRDGLSRRIAELLGLARRAGQAVSGFEKAGAWVRGGRAGLIMQALDGSADECSRFVGATTVTVIMPLSGAALGEIFGRERVVHVAVAPGKLAAALRMETERLSGLLAGKRA